MELDDDEEDEEEQSRRLEGASAFADNECSLAGCCAAFGSVTAI